MFRPLLKPTLWFLPMFAVLIGLGTWQIERLHWKVALIARMNANLSASPIALDAILALPNDQAQYRHVAITDHAIALLPDGADRPAPSIDLLLASAAEVFGEHLVAIILSGTGTDGADGARAVKAAGGTVIIQDPATAAFPGMRLVDFGHLGDGNLHYNVQAPEGVSPAAFLAAHEAAINRIVYDQVAKHAGSISAEHGIGRLKRDELAARKDPVALGLMRTIKQALDPQGLMNPGRVI